MGILPPSNMNGKFDAPLWGQWADGIKAAYNLKHISQGEWHGPCPCCGGKDRFWIKEQQGEVKAFCRQGCEIKDLAEAMQRDRVWPTPSNAKAFDLPSNISPFSDTTKTGAYHERKGVDLISASLDGDTVVVPIYNADRKQVGVQRITPDGKKKFSHGMTQGGAFTPIGRPQGGIVYICEGWATAVSVHMATGRQAIFALNSGNLPKVAEVLPKVYPDAEFIVAADHDDAGIKAAKETGLPYSLPPVGLDWNDVHAKMGLDAVRAGVQVMHGETTVIQDFHIDSTEAFLADMEPLEYLIDGVLPKGVTYSLTGHAGHGKTTLALQFALSVATGEQFGTRDTSKGSVLILAGENPHNVKWQYAAAIAARGLKPSDVTNIHFIQGRFSIDEMAEAFRSKVAQMPDLKLVIVDSLQAFFEGDNDNDNSQMVNMAHKLRGLCDIPSRPTLLVIAHPAGKVPSKDNLVPRGGGAFLAEIDGNLTVWSQDASQQTLHHSQKFRGASFDPMEWVMQIREFPHLTDIHKTPLKLPVSRPEMATESMTREDEIERRLETYLYTVEAEMPLSVRELASKSGITRWRAEQVVRTARDEKLIRRHAKTYILTAGGKDFLEGKSAGV